jgi:hypothetical protein
MAHRSSRLFRAQFRLLVDLHLLESAQQRLVDETSAGHRLRAWWTRREVVRRRTTIDLWRSEIADWKPKTLPESELLERLRPLLAVPLPAEASRIAPSTGTQALGWAATIGAAGAWGVVAANIAERGIGDRPALIVAELCALALSPIAIALAARRR